MTEACVVIHDSPSIIRVDESMAECHGVRQTKRQINKAQSIQRCRIRRREGVTFMFEFSSCNLVVMTAFCVSQYL